MNMSIRHRIITLIVISVLAIVAIGAYSMVQSRKNAVAVKMVTEGVVPSALETADLVSQVKGMQLITMALVSAPDINLANESRDKLEKGKAKLKESIAYQVAHATNKTQQGLVEQTSDNLLEYLNAIDDTVKFKLNGQSDIANANYFGNVVVLQRELQQIVDTLRIEKIREKDSAIKELNDNLAQTAMGVTTLSLLIMAALSLFGYILYRKIILPITKMQEATTEIAVSQDFTRRVPVKNMDEIGLSIVAFNLMISKIEENSHLLRQKTADIHSMLQNMPQGILMITADNRIHPEYSAYLESIFETEDVADRSMMDLVFSDTNLGSDTLAQIDATAAACIGEDVINFEFNQHLLVAEIEKKFANGVKKVLDLSWSPIIDEAGNCGRLMLCVRDVTELRKLAAEAGKQKHELEIIGEILSVKQEKFHEFIASSHKMLEENEALINEHAVFSQETISKLFRNLHTIKGNARTYALNHLTNTVHEAEQYYVELRKPDTDIRWDQAIQREILKQVKDEITYYNSINEVSLGRKGPGRRGSVEHYLMVNKEQIEQAIKLLEKTNTGNLQELLAAHDEVHKTLRLLGTERLIEILEGVFASLPALANELGKVAPIIDICDNGYVIHNQVSGLIKNVFMHLLRNSMDHGLETTGERARLNKPLAGTISLEMDVLDKMLQIRLSDDGRGLSLSHIRRLATAKNMLAEGEQIDDKKLANLIFQPGFTTAKNVTEVSGRGIGMDAVLNFVKRENGNVELAFTDDHTGAEYRNFEVIISLPEAVCESTKGFEFQLDETENEVTEISGGTTLLMKKA